MNVDDCLSRFTLASVKHRIIIIWKNITIEPVILLWALNYGVFHLTSQTLYIDKICKVNLNFTSEICDNIQQHENDTSRNMNPINCSIILFSFGIPTVWVWSSTMNPSPPSKNMKDDDKPKSKYRIFTFIAKN